MNDRRQQKPQQDTDTQGALIALIGALIVVLLLVANVQLAGLGDTGDQSSSGSVPKTATLPPPVQGTSNDVLARKLRKLSNGLTAPLNLLRNELNPLAGLPAGQLAVANSFNGLGTSVRKLGRLRTELSALSSGIDEVVGNTEALSGVGQDIHSTGRTTTDMVRTMRMLNRSVTEFGESANESIMQMNSGIDVMTQSLAATSSETRGMAGSLGELNTNMTEFLALFCVLLTSEASCTSKEAASTSRSSVLGEK